MIDYLKDIEPLENAGLNDSQIAEHLSARTATAIPCDETKVILEGSGAIVEDPVSQTRSGSLISHYSDLPNGEEKALLSWFISHVMVRGVEVGSNEYPRSIELAVVVQGLPGDLISVAAEILALGGGQPDAGTSSSDVNEIRQAYEAAQQEQARKDSIFALQAEIENTWINPAISDGTSTEAEVRAAIKAEL